MQINLILHSPLRRSSRKLAGNPSSLFSLDVSSDYGDRLVPIITCQQVPYWRRNSFGGTRMFAGEGPRYCHINMTPLTLTDSCVKEAFSAVKLSIKPKPRIAHSAAPTTNLGDTPPSSISSLRLHPQRQRAKVNIHLQYSVYRGLPSSTNWSRTGPMVNHLQ